MRPVCHRSAAATCVAAALTLMAAGDALAQMGGPDPRTDFDGGYGKSFGILGYESAVPTGDAGKFLSNNMSWLGVSLAGHWVLRRNASVGIEAGWNEFHDRTGGTTELSQGAITGEQYRHLMQFPLLVTGRYYLNAGTESRWRPFGGVGLGTYYNRQLLDLGVNEYSSDAWQFGLAPEVGALFITNSQSVVQLRVRYNYPVSSGDWLGGGSRSFNNFTFGIGMGFRH
jgi:hypothetical protein